MLTQKRIKMYCTMRQLKKKGLNRLQTILNISTELIFKIFINFKIQGTLTKKPNYFLFLPTKKLGDFFGELEVSHPLRKQLKTKTGQVDILPEEQNKIGSVVTETVCIRRTDGHQAIMYAPLGLKLGTGEELQRPRAHLYRSILLGPFTSDFSKSWKLGVNPFPGRTYWRAFMISSGVPGS